MKIYPMNFLQDASPKELEAFAACIVDALHSNLDGWPKKEARIISRFIQECCEIAKENANE